MKYKVGEYFRSFYSTGTIIYGKITRVVVEDTIASSFCSNIIYRYKLLYLIGGGSWDKKYTNRHFYEDSTFDENLSILEESEVKDSIIMDAL